MYMLYYLMNILYHIIPISLLQFLFVARKKFNHISTLHVVHHGIMPLSVWPGLRFMPGGHSSFFCFLNTFVHIFMYLYYFLAALGPKYKRYIWWKQHMTNLQMIQFIGMMIHAFQLIFYDDCDFPWQFSYYIGAHALLFFVLFGHFYVREYLYGQKKNKLVNECFQIIIKAINWKAKLLFIVLTQ